MTSDSDSEDAQLEADVLAALVAPFSYEQLEFLGKALLVVPLSTVLQTCYLFDMFKFQSFCH